MIRRLLRSLGRTGATVELDRIDAEVARWYVDDGTLSERALRPAARFSETRVALRDRRLRAVDRLERWGGRDPWPAVLREPTAAQTDAFRSRTPLPVVEFVDWIADLSDDDLRGLSWDRVRALARDARKGNL